MRHTVIIDRNRLVGRAIQQYVGLHCFDHGWTMRQAFEAASRRTPGMMVVGDDATRRIEQTATFTGPFRLDQIDEALAVAVGHEPSGGSEIPCG